MVDLLLVQHLGDSSRDAAIQQLVELVRVGRLVGLRWLVIVRIVALRLNVLNA